jgi:hypothetical protein
MLSNKLLLIDLAASSFASAVPSANGQSTRTWVSGTGSDTNPCSRTAPCRTFAGAMPQTAAGGEINALDPGGYGAVTVTKPVTIDGDGGQVASVLASGSHGIVVTAGPGAVVTLRNLRINGIVGSPTPDLNGVQFLTGAALHIENCTIFGFSQNGININANTASPVRVFVTDTVVSNSAGGIAAHNAGAGTVFVSLTPTSLNQNSGFGLKADGAGAGGITGTVSDSSISGNGTGVLAIGGPSAATTTIQVTRSSIGNNVTIGAQSNGTAGLAFILFSNSLITGNATGLSPVGGGNLISYKNNSFDGNTTPGAFTSTITPE